MAKKEYTRQHCEVGALEFMEETQARKGQKNGMSIPLRLVWKRNEIKLQWDVNFHCDNVIKARRPAIVVNKGKIKCIIVDIAVPGDSRTSGKKREKVGIYQDSKMEIKRIWNMRSVIVVPLENSECKKETERLEKLDITLIAAKDDITKNSQDAETSP